MPGFMSGNAALGAGSVSTSALADNAVTLAKMAGGTDGNLIGIDASGDPAYIATGSDGQVLTSGGAGVAALMETAAGGGVWNLIGTATASGSASLTVTGLDTTYETYAFEIVDIVSATDSIRAYVRLGDSSGIDSASGDYTWGVTGQNADSAMVNNTSRSNTSSDDDAAFMQIDPQPGGEFIGNATGEGFHASGKLYSGGGVVPHISGQLVMTDRYNTGPSGGLEILWGTFGGTRADQIVVTQIQLYMSSGNITSGSMSVYGISKT